MKAAMCVLRYLKNNPHQSLFCFYKMMYLSVLFVTQISEVVLYPENQLHVIVIFFWILPHLLANKEAEDNFSILNKI